MWVVGKWLTDGVAELLGFVEPMFDGLPEIDQGRLDEVPVQGHLDEVAAALVEPTLHSRNLAKKFVHLDDNK